MNDYRLARTWRFPVAVMTGLGFLCLCQSVVAADSLSEDAPDQLVPAKIGVNSKSPVNDSAYPIEIPIEAMGPPTPPRNLIQSGKPIAGDDGTAGAELPAEVDAKSLDFSAGPPEQLSLRIDPCKQFDGAETHWLDKQQVFVYRTVCGATAWFDGFFGDRRYDQATGDTFGRITIGGYWDERDGWDSRLRFRAKFALPSLREKGSLLIGRGDGQDLIEERDTSGTNPVPISPNTGQDDATFVGFGFDAVKKLSRALGFSAGVKLRAPPEPFVKIRYNRAWQLSERNLLRLRPIGYWRSEEGFGTTLNVDIDHVLSNSFLFRWSNFGNISEDEEVEGVDWGSTLYLFHAVTKDQAWTYSVFGRGETDADITFQNAGFEIRYRRRIFRDWLFLETGGGVSWPRYSAEEQREANFGLGLAFQAYFGPAPEDWMLQRR